MERNDYMKSEEKFIWAALLHAIDLVGQSMKI